MFNWLKSRREYSLDSVSESITAVAVLIDDTDRFRTAAAEAASTIGVRSIRALSGRLHSPPEAPRGFGSDERGLGGWLAAWQFAVFEVLYNLGEGALPTVRWIAYGEYYWTQGNAIEVLCRFAADGIRKEEIVEELKQRFPGLRYEAQLYAVQPLLVQAESNSNLAAILVELSEVEEFREAIEELRR